jgi:hypothetical protein
MPTFRVKARKTGPLVIGDVAAFTREEAITAVVDTALEGEEIQVWDVQELPEMGGGTGTTGATGTTGLTGTSFSWEGATRVAAGPTGTIAR